MRKKQSFDQEFFGILSENSEALLEPWVKKADAEQRSAAFLQSVRMGWMPGVTKMASEVDCDTVNHGVTFSIAANHFDILKYLIPLATPQYINTHIIGYAVDQDSVQAVTLLLPYLSTIPEGILSRAAEKGNIDIVNLLLPVCQTSTVSSALMSAAKQGYTTIVELLLPLCQKNIHNQALSVAAKGGWIDTVDFLLPLCDTIGINNAFSNAAEEGYIDIIRKLLPYSDPKNNNSNALRSAARYGFVDCVELLIPVSDPLSGDSGALSAASRFGHMECIKLLLPVSDPKANRNSALYWALENGHIECAEILCPVSDSYALLVYLKDHKEEDNHEYIATLLEDMIARQQKQVLETHIEKRRSAIDSGAEKVQRKI